LCLGAPGFSRGDIPWSPGARVSQFGCEIVVCSPGEILFCPPTLRVTGALVFRSFPSKIFKAWVVSPLEPGGQLPDWFSDIRGCATLRPRRQTALRPQGVRLRQPPPAMTGDRRFSLLKVPWPLWGAGLYPTRAYRACVEGWGVLPVRSVRQSAWGGCPEQSH